MSALDRRLNGLGLAQRALLRARMERLDAARRDAAAIPPRTGVGPVPMSFAQERIWVHQLMNPDGVAYHRPMCLHLDGPLQREALQQALDLLAARHEALRTSVLEEGGAAFLAVQPVGVSDLLWSDVSQAEAPTTQAEALLDDDARRPFEIGHEPLLRARLVRVAAGEHWLILVFHHLIFDATSESIVREELAELYRSVVSGTPPGLKPLALGPADVAVWDRSADRTARLAEGRAYWREEMRLAPVFMLSPDRPRSAKESGESETAGYRDFHLPPAMNRGVRTLARREGATVSSVLLTAFVTLLHRYSEASDLVIGCPASGRTRLETERLVGLFINLLPLRVRVADDDSGQSLLGRVHRSLLDGLRHQEVPLQWILEDLRARGEAAGTPLIRVMFVHERAAVDPSAAAGVTFGLRPVAPPGTATDLTLEIFESDAGIAGRWVYRSALWTTEEIVRMGLHFQKLLEGIVDTPAVPVGRLPILGTEERNRLLREWNETAAPYPHDFGLHQLFERQAVATPGAMAVRCGERALTYAELNVASERVARHLRGLGVRPDALVGLCLERSPELLVGILGILKAGGAYVPLDAAHPPSRVAAILRDAGLELVVTEGDLVPLLPETGARRVLLDGCMDSDWGSTATNPTTCIDAGIDDTVSFGPRAYVIYTSGSTGQPKGVPIRHRSVVALISAFQRMIPLSPGMRFLGVASPGFDISVLEYFLPLSQGATAVLVSGEVSRDAPSLTEAIRQTAPNAMQATPATWRALLESGWTGDRALTAISGGEALTGVLRLRLAEACGILWDAYGPTETTIYSTAHRVEAGSNGPTASVIGRPVANTEVYVLDRYREPVPIGVPGELYIAGDGVSDGYLNRPDLTAERFVENPYDTDPQSRLYRTGDQCRWREDGTLEFLGRLDHQVKLRGFRIELGEIEAALRELSIVAQAAVLLREDRAGDPRLVAYVVAAAGERLEAAALRRHLAGRLPEYMVPSVIVVLEALPLSVSGKLDRKALPVPDDSRPNLGTAPVVPATALEAGLASLWREVLGVSGIGVHDNFFALGGHSLAALRMLTAASHRWNVHLRLPDLLGQPTVAGLADRIAAAVGAPDEPSIPRATASGGIRVPATGEQINLWIAHQVAADSAAYHIVFATRLRGPLDLGRLEWAWRCVMDRQDILRTLLQMEGEELVQEISELSGPVLKVEDLEDVDSAGAETAVRQRLHEFARAPLDPAVAPLWRMLVLRRGSGEHVLALSIHHVLVDEWSVHLLYSDLAAFYESGEGAVPDLPKLPIRFADFAVWQQAQLGDVERDRQEAFWKGTLAGLGERMSLPSDRTGSRLPTGRSVRMTFSIPSASRSAMAALAVQERTTAFVVALAAWQGWLGEWTGWRDVVVGTPVAERTRPEVQHLAGLFLQTLPIRATIDPSVNFRTLVREVRQRVTDAFQHGGIPLARMVSSLLLPTGVRGSFPTLFTLVDRPWPTMQLPGTTAERVPVHNGAAKADLVLFLTPDTLGGWTAELEYSEDRFSAEFAQRMVGQFRDFVARVASHPDDVLNPAVPRVASDRTIPRRFAEQVARSPDAEAVVCGAQRWNYRELDLLSDGLAVELKAMGVSVGGRVGLHLERSPEWIVAALAVLKAGAAYVPLMPGWPGPRLQALAAGADIQWVLGIGSSAPEWLPAEIPFLDGGLRPTPVVADAFVSPPGLTSESPAYLLFTSGTTGQPKAVVVPHRAVHRLVVGQHYVTLSPDLRCLHLASPAFDASTFEVWAPLLNGGACVVFPEKHPDADLLQQEIRLHRVNCLFLTTGLFNQIIDLRPAALEGVRDLLTGGEVLSELHARKALEALPGTRLIHCYGPTETTTFATAGIIPPVAEWSPDHPVPIGRPLAGTWCDILDSDGHLVPEGEPGELYLGGDGVALGYGNDPELTAARFVPDPSDSTGRARWYRTGDRVLRLPDGRLVFLGRLDAQVKIRGHRIEPGEIEAVLSEHPLVRQALVIARPSPGGVQELVACIQAFPGTAVDFGMLRQHLASRLPDYMMPAVFRQLEAIPLTSTGKVDRTALAAEGDPAPRSALPSAAPRTPLEQVLCQTWATVLERPSIGIHDNFFEHGGQSLIALRLVGRLQQVLNRPVRLADLFARPTVAQLAGVLGDGPSPAVPVSGLFRGQETGTPWFHVPGVFGVEFLTPVLAELIGRHRPFFDGFQYPGLDGQSEPLRTAEAIAGALVRQLQEICPHGPVWLSGYSFGGEVAHEMARQLTGQGRIVERVVLFDSCVRGALRRRAPGEILRALAKRTRARPPGERIPYLGRILARKMGDGWRGLVRPLTRAAWGPRERVEAASMEAHANHLPRTYGGRVCLLRSTEAMPRDTGIWDRDPFNGWDPWRTPDFEVISLACDHESIFQEPVAPPVLAAVEALLTSKVGTGRLGDETSRRVLQ